MGLGHFLRTGKGWSARQKDKDSSKKAVRQREGKEPERRKHLWRPTEHPGDRRQR